MKRKFGLATMSAILFLALSMTSSGKTLKASANQTVFNNNNGESIQSQLQTKQPSQEFQGTIERNGTKYILADKASGANYQLSDQDKARQFYGKDVKVTGTLDPSTNTIDVSAIKEMK